MTLVLFKLSTYDFRSFILLLRESTAFATLFTLLFIFQVTFGLVLCFRVLLYFTAVCLCVWIGIYLNIFLITRPNKYKYLAITSLILSTPTFMGSLIVIMPMLDQLTR